MFPYVMLHDAVVAMGIYANVPVMGEAEIHDVAEDVVFIRVTRNAMDDMVGLFVIEPFSAIDLAVGWLRGG